MKISVSIVVPVYNEEGNVAELHREIVEVCERNNYTYEVIFIDDGSQDKTVQICKTLKPLKLIQMRKRDSITELNNIKNQNFIENQLESFGDYIINLIII